MPLVPVYVHTIALVVFILKFVKTCAFAYRPSPLAPNLFTFVATTKMAVNDMLGADVETNGVFDPLGYGKDDASLFRRRAVELKHGRVAMLAVTGYLFAEQWHPL